MRTNLFKKHNTKPERIFGRLLQENKIEFRTKEIIGGREIDFIIGNLAIEIDGHDQDVDKNHLLLELGYSPVHISNEEIYNDRHGVINRIIDLTK